MSAYRNIREEIYLQIDICFFRNSSQQRRLILNRVGDKIRQS